MFWLNRGRMEINMPNISSLIQSVKSGEFDKAFKKLYSSSPEMVEKQRARYIETIESFAQLFGEDRDVAIYSAPGRTEIGGNHTDHNNGVVMAAAVNLDVIAVVAKSDNGIIQVKSKGFDRVDVIDILELEKNESEFGRSSALIRGICADILNRGGEVGGFDAYTTSDVLRGSGLSSSAAFEVVIGAILNGEYNNFKFTPVEIAQISQFAENVFFGKPSGLMDQTASSVGGAITIDFKDTSAPVVTKVELDLAKHEFALCITDTKGSHAGLTDEYAAVRLEMEQVAAYFGKSVLREVDEQDIYKNMAKLREKLPDRAVLRAMHFFAETNRAIKLCNAVREDKFDEFLKLIIENGHSSYEYNQNAYSVKNTKEQGVCVGLALSQKVLSGKGAWRLQGGGFAGTIQAFVPLTALNEYYELMESVFGQGACYVLNIRNFGAVRVEKDM